jgi:hypothetical protein
MVVNRHRLTPKPHDHTASVPGGDDRPKRSATPVSG